MAKENRPIGQVPDFATTGAPASDLYVFGTTTESTNVSELIGPSSRFGRGYGFVQETSPETKPDFQLFNALMYSTFKLHRHVYQNGMPEWSTDETYYINSLTNRNGVVYRSKTDANTGNDPATDANETNWENKNANDVEPLDTLADLRALTTPYARVRLSGYHTKNDGAFGSNFFRLKGTATTEVDNGGTIILVTINSIEYVYELAYNGDIRVKWFGIMGSILRGDETLVIQAVIDYYADTQELLLFEDKSYLITDTINIYNGTKLKGTMEGGFTAWNFDATRLLSTQIKFIPTSPKPLFVLSEINHAFGAISQSYIGGMWIIGDETSNSTIALDLTDAYHSNYEYLLVTGFELGIKAYHTIMNRFENILIGKCDITVEYGDTATSDVWNRCTFTQSRLGVRSFGSVNIRFDNCLIEQIEDYGFDVDASDSAMIVNNLYCEDVPFLNNVTNPCVFRVGGHGVLTAGTPQLVINNGSIRGRNSSANGSFLYVNQTDGVTISNTFARKFNEIITTEVGVEDRTIQISNLEATTYTTLFTHPTKIQGTYSNKTSEATRSVTAKYNIVEASQVKIADSLDLNQTFTDVAVSRTFSTVYTNNTGRPMFIVIQLLSAASTQLNANFYVNGITAVRTKQPAIVGDSSISSITMQVNPLDTYRLETTAADVILSWKEIR